MKLIAEHDPRLRLVSKPVTDIPQQAALVQAMREIMQQQHAVGISAVQIGVHLRVFLMQDLDQEYVCFNPEILSAEEDCQDTEGSLSFPGIFIQVPRKNRIRVRFTDLQEYEHVTEFTGLMSRCFQHELDHLNGICFDQRVSRLKFQMAKKRRR